MNESKPNSWTYAQAVEWWEDMTSYQGWVSCILYDPNELESMVAAMIAEVERLRAERERVIRLGPHPVEQVEMPLDVFIKTRFVPVWEFNELADKAERLRAEVQRLDIAGTHTCHDDCPKLPCVHRREIERLKDENEWMGIAGQQMARHLAEAKAELAAAKAASVCPVEVVSIKPEGTLSRGHWVSVTVKGGQEKGAAFVSWLCERMKGG